MAMRVIVGVDVGGTNTDAVVVCDGCVKGKAKVYIYRNTDAVVLCDGCVKGKAKVNNNFGTFHSI